MNREKEIDFLFAIAREVKISYECPVLFLTQTDYGDDLHRTLVNLYTALVENEAKEKITDIINAFHFAWLDAVHQIEIWKKRSKDVPRETILKMPDYTIRCITFRHSRFESFLERTLKLLTQVEKESIDAETSVIKDLRDINISALLDKRRCLGNAVDKTEFSLLVADETSELLNWLDRLYNFVAFEACTLLELEQLPADLTRTLKDAIDKLTRSLKETSSLYISKSVSSTSQPAAVHEYDITKINTKISRLKYKISQLKTEKSAASNPLAVQHKVIFLRERIESLQNLRSSLCCFKRKESDENDENQGDTNKANVCFHHLLPHEHRCRLVEDLIQEWYNAINNFQAKSLISVMNTGDAEEEYTDEYGKFTVDDYGRKIYKSKSGDALYQLDGTNTLVPLDDDAEHIYFYDALGRYYLNEDRERVYKAHARASEYILHYTGKLHKLKETIDGVEYCYDHLGRYYVQDGQRIYCDPDSTDEYISDGLGNLVKIRYEDQDHLTYCPVEPMATEESLYLKKTVGEALKKCIAEVCMLTPQDPVKYLGERLLKYHHDMMINEERKLEAEEMHAERVRLEALERERALREATVEPSVEGGESSSFDDSTDYNFINYATGTNL